MSLDEVKTNLAKARAALRLSQATETRLTSELQRQQWSGTVSPDILKDNELALGRVRAMVVAHQKRIHALEAICARLAPAHAACRPTPVLGTPSSPALPRPNEQAFDKLGTLEREFNEALAVFDGMLLRESETIRARSAKRMTDSAAAAAAKRQRDKGVALGTSVSDVMSEDTSAAEQAEAAERQGRERTTEVEGRRRAGQMQAAQDAGKGPRLPGQRRESPRHDEDIVARQLREAAEQETDPELREKLWQEYEAYTTGRK